MHRKLMIEIPYNEEMTPSATSELFINANNAFPLPLSTFLDLQVSAICIIRINICFISLFLLFNLKCSVDHCLSFSSFFLLAIVLSALLPLKTCGVCLVTNPEISHEWGKDREVLTTSGTYSWSFVTQIFITVNQVMVASVKLSKITGFVTRWTRRVPLVEQKLLTFPEHPRVLVGFVLFDL
jgi:hypothetical protein